MNALKGDKPMLRAKTKTRETPQIAAKADAVLAVSGFCPNKLNAAERVQKYSGGFSRKGLPFSLGTIMSPDLSISAAIPATLGSSGPDKGFCPRPTRKRRAAYTTRQRKYMPALRLSSILIEKGTAISNVSPYM